MKIKGIVARGVPFLYRSDLSGLPLFYKCPYFHVKFFPKDTYCSAFQKTYPFAIHYEYARKDSTVYNIPMLKLQHTSGSPGKLSSVLDDLRIVAGSLDPLDAVFIRRRARCHVRDKVQDFFLSVANKENIQLMTKYEKKKAFEAMSDSDIPSKYHGFFSFRFLRAPSLLNKEEFDTHLNYCLSKFSKMKVFDNKDYVRYSVGTKPSHNNNNNNNNNNKNNNNTNNNNNDLGNSYYMLSISKEQHQRKLMTLVNLKVTVESLSDPDGSKEKEVVAMNLQKNNLLRLYQWKSTNEAKR